MDRPAQVVASKEQDMSLAQITVSELGAFCFVGVFICLAGNGLGQAIAYRQVIQECNKLGGFYYHSKVFECKEKKT